MDKPVTVKTEAEEVRREFARVAAENREARRRSRLAVRALQSALDHLPEPPEKAASKE